MLQLSYGLLLSQENASMDSFIFDLMETHDYENIFFCQEKALGLKAIIAIHDTTNAIAGLCQEASIPVSRVSSARLPDEQ